MSNSQVLTLREYQTLRDVYLEDNVVKGLQQRYSRVLKVTPSMTENKYHLTAKSIVGVLTYQNVAIQVQPKVEISALWDWLAVAFDLKSIEFQNEYFGFKQMFGSLEWIVKFFLHECKKIYGKGILKGYVTKEEPLKTVRGQWQSGKTFHRWLKHDYQFDCRFDELTEDVIENQIIAMTIKDILLRKYMDIQVTKDGKQLLSLFGEEIDPLVLDQKYSSDKWIKVIDNLPRNRLNTHYNQAFKWAALYWKASSLAFELGHTKSTAFFLDMNELFEVYVSKLLKQKLQPFDINVILQKRDYLAENGRIRIIPDLIIEGPSGERVIMDLKYITRQDESSINSNVFQMLAYLVANKTKHGILLYAGGSERLDKIKNSGFIICQWSLNLERGLNSEQIEIRIEGVVEEVVGILKR